jgi:hypothetical protein
MRGTKYSAEQIIGILKAAEKGFPQLSFAGSIQHVRPQMHEALILIQTDGGPTAPGR